MGYCSETRHLHTLTNEFVEINFTEGFLQQVKRMGEHWKPSFIYVPPGADRQHENQPYVVEMLLL